MKIAFLTRDIHGLPPVPGGCAYYRCYLPMHALAANGHRVSMGFPVYDPIRGYGVRERDGYGVFGFDTIVLKLIMDKPAATQMRLAKNNTGQRFIVDVDDFYQGLTPANKAYTLSHPDINPWSNRDHYENVISEADTVTVSTPFLYDYYKERHPDVRLVRNAVNVQMFDQRLQADKPLFGWAGATNFRNNDLEQLADWLPAFLEEHDLMFHHAGASDNAPAFHDITGVDPDRMIYTPLTNILGYADGFRFDVGIVPLSDIPFNHAKSNIKGLEYASAGIPFIASDLPEYRILHTDGAGALARTADEWRGAAEVMLSRSIRLKEASRGRQTVLRNWSLEARQDDWITALSPRTSPDPR